MTRRALLLCCTLLAASMAGASARAPKAVTAELGREFTLRKGQTARLKGTDAVLRLAGFINSPCPKGARCVWSGLAVTLELTVAGKAVPLDEKAPYAVQVKNTDYKTRATLLASARVTEKP